MSVRRIHIIGGAGSGKSYIAARLSEHLEIPTLDLDDIFWDNASGHYDRRAPADQRDCAFAAILKRCAWIIEGVYHAWLAESFRRADVVIILCPSVWLRHWHALARFAKRRLGLIPSKKRETLKGLWGLLTWDHAYDGDNLARARIMLAKLGVGSVDCRTLDDVWHAVQRGTNQ
jgi:adenylate kinase family enzyme